MDINCDLFITYVTHFHLIHQLTPLFPMSSTLCLLVCVISGVQLGLLIGARVRVVHRSVGTLSVATSLKKMLRNEFQLVTARLFNMDDLNGP